MLALALAAAGNDDEARQCADRTCALGFPADHAPIADLYAQLAMRAGDFDAARACLRGALTAHELAAGGGEAVNALCAALSGTADQDSAIAKVTTFERALDSAALNAVPRRRLALWYALLDAQPEAFAIVERALDRDAAQGSVGSAWGYLWSPEMASFRAHDRFTPLVARLKLPRYWQVHGFPQLPR